MDRTDSDILYGLYFNSLPAARQADPESKRSAHGQMGPLPGFWRTGILVERILENLRMAAVLYYSPVFIALWLVDRNTANQRYHQGQKLRVYGYSGRRHRWHYRGIPIYAVL